MSRRANTMEDFWHNVDVRGPDECWEWQRSTTSHGYGRFSMDSRFCLAHRLALSTVCDIPKGMHVLHSCDNRKCCNPAHLSVGTQKENVRDMVEKMRQNLGEKNGSAKLTEYDVSIIRSLDIPNKQIASMFNVSQSTISEIRSCKRWAHIKAAY